MQITKKEGGFPLFVSPDGRWLYYHHGLDRTLWRVSTGGGQEQLVLNKAEDYFTFSPDGLQVACFEGQGEETALTIVSLAAGQSVKTFRLADGGARLTAIAWLPDGKSVAYNLADDDFENNTLWFQPLDGQPPRRIADLGDEAVHSLALSPDGKAVAIVQGSWKHDAVLLKGLR